MRAGIGLGSNLGDRGRTLREAIARLRELSDAPERDRVSSLYETQPVGCAPGTPPFLNAVMEIETELAPLTLLARLQDLEQASGRPAVRAKNEPRQLDLDLLYLGNLTLNDQQLQLPHPLLAVRLFVLAPLAEIVPDLILPDQRQSIQELARAQTNSKSEIIIISK